MSIPEFVNRRTRPNIAIHGAASAEDARKVLQVLGYEVEEFTLADFQDADKLALVDSAVIFLDAANPPGPKKMEAFFESTLAGLMRHGCRVYLGASGADVQAVHLRPTMASVLRKMGLPSTGVPAKDLEDPLAAEQPVFQPCVRILADANDWTEIARLVTTNPADVGADSQTDVQAEQPDGTKVDLDEETKALVRRAFSDCSSVRMIKEVDGLSDVAVYRSYAELRKGALGPYPYLQFVKVGERSKIEKEFQRYRSTAMQYVPFHLGPRLRQDQCALGYRKGLIVGDYVTGAEKLRDCARDGRATHVIANLFNYTLRSWRVTAKPSENTLADAFEQKWKQGPSEWNWRDEIPKWRETEIRKLGAKKTLAELKALFVQVTQEKFLAGAVHGDLHATNVLARLTDGIVIDFEKVEMGMPIVFDPASLESGLFIDGFIGDPRPADAVLASILDMYNAECFAKDGDPCHPGDRSAWYFDCVRQIRLHARQMEQASYSYAAVLAFCFIRKACNTRNFSDEKGGGLSRETVRAMGYVIGERILEALASATKGKK